MEKNMEKDAGGENSQLRVFKESGRPLLYLFYGKCKMLLARGEVIWMYDRQKVVEIMSGLGNCWKEDQKEARVV